MTIEVPKKECFVAASRASPADRAAGPETQLGCPALVRGFPSFARVTSCRFAASPEGSCRRPAWRDASMRGALLHSASKCFILLINNDLA